MQNNSFVVICFYRSNIVLHQHQKLKHLSTKDETMKIIGGGGGIVECHNQMNTRKIAVTNIQAGS